jgi:hypothetical protein
LAGSIIVEDEARVEGLVDARARREEVDERDSKLEGRPQRAVVGLID